jgi:Na+/melibiose symporter-like transporter
MVAYAAVTEIRKESDCGRGIRAISGYRFTSGIVVGLLFAACTAMLLAYKLNKGMTLQMADELAERRKNFATQPQCA